MKNITVTVFVYFVFSNVSNNLSGSTFSTIIVQWINKREHHAHYFLPLKVLKYDSIQNLFIWIGTMKFLEML